MRSIFEMLSDDLPESEGERALPYKEEEGGYEAV